MLWGLSLFGKPLKVEVATPSVILINAETGKVLYEKNCHERRYPASITKIVTAFYVLEKHGHELDRVAAATAHALMSVPGHIKQAPDTIHPPYRLEHDGTSMRLRVGEEHNLRTLLYGLMLPSGNDAANVIAEHLGGSIENFMQELNLYLNNHGLLESHFTNPHGLHHKDHWTTAYDMALMTQKALKHPLFREIVKSTKYLCPRSSLQPARELQQHNRLLRPGAYFYPKATGVKLGYHSKAAGTLVASAQHEGRELIAVLMGCTEKGRVFLDAKRLFEAAFAEKPIRRVLFTKEGDRFSHEVRGAGHLLKAVLKEDLVLEYFPAEESRLRAEIEWSKLKLPVQAGEIVGFLRLVEENGGVLKQLPLLATESLERKWWVAPFDFFKTHKSFFVAVFLTGQVVLLVFYFLKKSQKVGER